MKMFFFRCKVKPDPMDEKYAQYSGGYACVWVADDDKLNAKDRAVELIEGEGWETGDSIEVRVVTRESHEQTPVLLALFDKAHTDGIAATFDVFTGGGKQFN